uniref:Uncharacterized protein n=1 Tax=Periophthalmus magnuspinnatus TaxID=409849 RepID=A0A3B4B3C1_9GOBI
MAARTVVLICAILIGLSIVTTAHINKNLYIFLNVYSTIKDFKLSIYSCVQLLSPAVPGLIQANHTSGSGQFESVNFTIIGTSMGMGCHVEVGEFYTLLHLIFYYKVLFLCFQCLIAGSGLSRAPGFVEFTNEWLCLGVGISACN